MKLRKLVILVSVLLACAIASELVRPSLMQQSLVPPSLMENLGRGVVALRTSATEVFVSWRILGTDPSDVAFNLYRSTGAGPAALLNGTPLTGPTHFTDNTADLSQANAYFVRPIIFNAEQNPSASFTLPAGAPSQQFLRLPLQIPPNGTTPLGDPYSYTANDCSVGDLDGDGEYEIVVKWDPTNAQDNSNAGLTGEVYLDGYKLDGTRLWRINLGKNIRAGAHYTQFMVYDLDGDGVAEIACKTADGTVDGVGAVIGDANADWRDIAPNPVSGRIGYVLNGPEFLTIFNGQTGAAMVTVPYNPPRGNVNDWGDNYGNRVDRFLASVAYLDGQRPSLVVCRGYYTRTVLAAYDWRNGALTERWTFDTGHTGTANPFAAYRGQGNHNLSVADVDSDGKDEIIYGACAINDDGTGLYSTGLGHGDALHVSDLDPDRPGLEVFQPHESPTAYGPNGLELRDARTGALIFGVQGGTDIGRGLAIDVDPRYRGYEMWGSGPTGGMYTAQQSTPNALLGSRGVEIAPNEPSINHAIWWDGDLLRELLDGAAISKWDWASTPGGAGAVTTLLAPPGIASNNGTKANPCLTADILGDWREEAIWRESNNSALRIYVSTIPTAHRFYTLMHDRMYREAIAWQNVGYNQPPHPSFFFGDGMAPPPVANIVTSLDVLLGPPAPVFTGVSDDNGALANDNVTNDQTLILHGTAQPNTTIAITRLGVGAIGTTPANASGIWSFNYTGTSLPQGETVFTATATDAGNVTGAQTNPPFRVTIDVTPPPAPVITDIALDATLTFTGTSEPGSTVTVTLTGTGVVATGVASSNGKWTASFIGPQPPPGSHIFTAIAVDLAGNPGPASGAVTVNTSITTPIITSITDDTGASPTDGITSDTTLTISGTASPGDTITVKLLGGSSIGTTTAAGGGAWSFNYSGTPLADGAYAFSASASNASGTSPASPAFPVTVDTAAPTVVSVNRLNPSVPASVVASITFRVTFREPVNGVDTADFTPVFSGGLSGAITNVAPAGPASFDVTLDPLTGEGSVRLDVNAGGTGISDTAGNPLAGGFTTGQTYTRTLVGNGVWTRSASGGLWGENANWLEGIVGGNGGSTADFSTLELGDNIVVHLDAPRTIGNLIFGDTDIGSVAGWVIDNNGNAANTLTLASTGSPSIVTNPLGVGATTTIATILAGNQGFTKSGAGTLVLTQPNVVTGPINVTAGTLQLPPDGAINSGSGAINVTNSNGVTLRLNGGSLTAGGLMTLGSGGGAGNMAGFLILDGGTATLNGGARTNSEFGSTYRINGGLFNSSDVNIRRNSGAAPDFGSGFILAGGSANVGTISLGTANSTGAMSVESGSLTATGMITIGNQTSGGRGGALRVLGGIFTSTHTAPGNTPGGIVMSRNSGANTNNVSSATFTGGVSTVEKVTLGFDAAVNAGSATINLNGGTLYLGGGGIIKNGASGLATNLNFSSGLLGAKADWGTSLPITLPSNGNVVFKAADAADVAHNITLTGALSGAGGFTKTGGGRLLLGAANTFTGAVAVNGGALDIDGSLAAGSDVAVNSGGTLTGDGSSNRNVVLNSGGALRPGSTTPGSALTAASLTWNVGGAMAFELGSSANQLALTGALTRGGAGPRNFVFTAAPGLAIGNIYTLVTFASADFTASDFTFSGLPQGFTGAFAVTANSLVFEVFGPPVIVTQPQSVTVLMGGTATFSVVVNSSPALSYQWFKDNTTIAGATSASLTIANVQAANIGSYTVTVSNGAGSVTSNPATLSIAARALVRHAPVLNSAVLEGFIQQMLGESVTLNGSASVRGDLLVPGTPNVVLNGSPAYGGTLDGSGSAAPSNYTVTLNNNTALGHVVRRTDPVPLPTVGAPAAPTGTRSVTLNSPGQSLGVWATVRNLTLNGNVGQIAVPAGAYGNFTANGGNGFTLGVAGATEPAVYHFQNLTLNSQTQVQVVGPVIVIVANGFNVNGGAVGNSAHSAWLTLNLYTGGLALNSGASVYGYVTVPNGTLTVNGNCQVVGGVACDRLTMNSNGRLHLIDTSN